MRLNAHCPTLVAVITLLGSLAGHAQLHPEATAKPAQSTMPKSAQKPGPTGGTDLIVLKADTPVSLRLSENLRTNEGGAVAGVRFQVTREVWVDDSVLIARGAEAWGTAEITEGRSYVRNGKAVLRMDAVYAVTGAQVSLRGDTSARGKAGCVDYDCIVLLVLAPLIKGQDAPFPKGTKVQAFVAKDISFDRDEVKKASEERERAEAMDREARSGEAVIHVYRLSDHAGGGKPEVFLDGKSVARMAEGFCVKLTVKPGQHILAAGKLEIVFRPEGGEQYYVRVSKSGPFNNKVKLELVPGEQGEEESYPFTPER